MCCRHPFTKRFLLVLAFFGCCRHGLGQSILPADSQSTTFPLLLSKDTAVRPRFKRATLQLGLAEVIPFAVDRYIRNVDYAHISFGTVGHNLMPSSWSWDDDDFGNNQFAHPIMGASFSVPLIIGEAF